MQIGSLVRTAVEASSVGVVASPSSVASSSTLPSRARIAIVGAGPSGFYAASRLLSRIPYASNASLQEQSLSIDIFDRLPVPHGLVRYGVAPDHPDVKNIENKFASISTDPRMRFAGNVNVVQSTAAGPNPYPMAVQLPLHVLSRYYTHILFSYGASLGRLLGIPGSAEGELSNVYSALSFVNWYNGHPASHDPSLRPGHNFSVDLSHKHHMTVIGAGNVALDVARIVLRSSTPFLDPLAFSSSSTRSTSNKAPGLAALEETDVPEPVLAELARSKIRDVDIFARRGPAQLAFTNKEVREMLSLDGIALQPPSKELLETALAQLDQLATSASHINADPDAAATVASEVRVKKRLLSLLSKGSKTKYASSTEPNVKSWSLNFFRSPARFLPKEDSNTSPTWSNNRNGARNAPAVGNVEWNVTTLQSGRPTEASLDATDPRKAAWGSGANDALAASASTATGQTVTTKTDLVVSSVGYQSEALYSPASDPSPPQESSVNAQHDAVSTRADHHNSVVAERNLLTRLPFDDRRNVVPNRAGRVFDPVTRETIPGVYVSGWLARGPNGVIVTTMMDAYTVADTILNDLQPAAASATSQHQSAAGEREDFTRQDLLSNLASTSNQKIIDFDGWRRLDQEERRRGQKLGKLREKVLTIKEMLDIAA